jgi:hypothetical protein
MDLPPRLHPHQPQTRDADMTCPKQFVSQPVVTEILDQSAVHDELRSDTCCAAERRLSAVEVGEPLLVGVTAPLGDHRGVGCPVQCSLQPGYLALRVVSCCLAWSSSSVRWSMVVFRSATWCWFASSRDSASERSDSASCNRSRPPQHVSAARPAALQCSVDGPGLGSSGALGRRTAHGSGFHRREVGGFAALVDDTESDMA